MWCFFFFSSRRRHTRCYRDWSSDVCSSDLWFALNTSKRGVTLDLETEDGRELFKALVRTTDFVIESFPPGYLAGLGLGYDDLARINPSIIVTSITAFGQTGPYAHYRASDIVGVAMGGLM